MVAMSASALGPYMNNMKCMRVSYNRVISEKVSAEKSRGCSAGYPLGCAAGKPC